MKIGIFTECYLPVMNGVVVSIETFKKYFESLGHEVFIFAPDHPEAKKQKNVYRFPSVSDPKERLYPVTFPSLTYEKMFLPDKILKELDVIHAQHMFTMGRLARYCAKKYNKPLVYTYHTLIAEYTHYMPLVSDIFKRYLISMSRRFCNRVDRVIAPSESLRKILLRYKIKTPIEVVMTGIDPKNYSRECGVELRKRYGIGENEKIVLFLSRIAREKNIDLLLKAYKKIWAEVPGVHLFLVGGGPEEAYYKKMISDMALKNVIMTGMVPKEEANKFFGMADVFAFPSHTETQGIVVAEAMASGTPPVAVNRMGPSNLIRDGVDGFLTRINVEDFSRRVILLLKDEKLRKKMGVEGVKRADFYSTSSQGDKLLRIYGDLI